MKEKIKLTELTKEELRHVTGGNMGIVMTKCDCSGTKQTFGQEDSEKISKPLSPITKPIVKPLKP
jgi:bacteriocin-like protein